MISNKYSMIIYSEDGEEVSRFDNVYRNDLFRKIKAAIEVGGYAVIDAASGIEDPEEAGEIFITDNRGIV